MRDVLKDLFSRSVAVTDTRDSMIDSSFLSLNERTYLENVSQNRKNEYIAGRFCAHQSMALANIPPVHIPIGNKGEPIWPSGVVGSITHSRGYAAAAVAKQSDVHSLGLEQYDSSKSRRKPFFLILADNFVSACLRHVSLLTRVLNLSKTNDFFQN